MDLADNEWNISNVTIGDGIIGNKALYFNNSSMTADLGIIDGDFTISFWCALDNITITGYPYWFWVPIFDLVQPSNYFFRMMALSPRDLSEIALWISASVAVDDEYFIKNENLIGETRHIALCRKDNNFLIFLDGILKATIEIDPNSIISPTPIRIGHRNDRDVYIMGTLDDFCIIKNTALWTKDFTPPTTYLPDNLDRI